MPIPRGSPKVLLRAPTPDRAEFLLGPVARVCSLGYFAVRLPFVIVPSLK
jgi:hypothetical protein